MRIPPPFLSQSCQYHLSSPLSKSASLVTALFEHTGRGVANAAVIFPLVDMRYGAKRLWHSSPQQWSCNGWRADRMGGVLFWHWEKRVLPLIHQHSEARLRGMHHSQRRKRLVTVHSFHSLLWWKCSPFHRRTRSKDSTLPLKGEQRSSLLTPTTSMSPSGLRFCFIKKHECTEHKVFSFFFTPTPSALHPTVVGGLIKRFFPFPTADQHVTSVVLFLFVSLSDKFWIRPPGGGLELKWSLKRLWGLQEENRWAWIHLH